MFFGTRPRRQRSYEKDGEKRTVFEVVVNNIEFLERIKKEEEKPTEPPKVEEEYYQPSLDEDDEDDEAMLPFDIGD